jgi:hypothetical protein
MTVKYFIEAIHGQYFGRLMLDGKNKPEQLIVTTYMV